MNTVMILFLGIAVGAGASATLLQALCAGVAVLATIVISGAILNATKTLFADSKFTATLIVVTGVVSAVSMLLNAFMPGYGSVASYVACLSANLLVYASVDCSIADGFKTGLKFLVAICIIGALREVFGAAAICGVSIEFLKNKTISVLNAPAGGMMIAAFVMAVFNKEKTCVFENEFMNKVFNDKKGEEE